MNKLLLALITAAFAAVGAYAADTKKEEAKPEAAAASAPKKEHVKKEAHKQEPKKAHAPAAAASK